MKAGVPIARVVNGFGILRGANETRSIISVLAEFGEVELEVEAGQVRSVYDGKIGFVVEFDIEAQFSAEERISKVISTKSVDLVEDGPDIPRISDRLTSFTKLSEGWLDGEGLPVSNEVAETALDLSRFVNSTYSDLRVYPTTAGGVRLEYSRDDLDVSIEIDADLSLTLHALDLETEKEKLFKDKVVSHDLLSLIMNVGELS